MYNRMLVPLDGSELDLNPVKVLEGNNSYMVVDARVMLA